MFEFLRSPTTGDLIPARPALFLPRPNASISSRQSGAVSLGNAASWDVVWDGLRLRSLKASIGGADGGIALQRNRLLFVTRRWR